MAEELIVYEAINDTNQSCKFYEEKGYLLEKSKFIGICKNGFIEGNATITHHNGHQYIGSFKNGYYHGYGKFLWTTESYIEGVFTQNYLTGFGTDYNEGVISNGDFYKNIFTGYGTYSLSKNKKIIVNKGKEELLQATIFENNTYETDINLTQSIFYLKKSIKIREKYLKEHPILADNYSNLSKKLAQIKNLTKLEEALVYSKLSLKIKKHLFRVDSSEVSGEYNNLSLILSDLGRAYEAIYYAEKGKNIDEKIFNKLNPNLAQVYGNLALLYKDNNQLSKAKKYIQKSLKIRREIDDNNSTDLAVDFNTLSLIYQDLGDFEKAEENALKSLKLNQKNLGEEHDYVIKSYSNLSMLYLDLHNLKKAKEFADIFLALGEKKFQNNLYDLSALYSNISLVYKRLNDVTSAKKYAKKSMKIAEKIMNKNHPSLATIYNHLALIYEAENHLINALDYAQKTLEIRKNNNNTVGLMIAYRDISFIYTELKEYDKAFDYYLKSFKLFLDSRKFLSQLNNRAKKSYLDNTNIHIYNLLDMSLLVKQDVSRRVFNAWLQYKGELFAVENHIMSISIEMAKENIIFHNNNDEVIPLKIEKLRKIKEQYSKTFLDKMFSFSELKEKEFIQFQEKKENLEEYLSNKVSEYNLSNNLNEINCSQIRQYLDKDELYIDFAKTDRNYYIFTLDHNNHVEYKSIDKPIEVVDGLIKKFREGIINIDKKKRSKILYKLLLKDTIPTINRYKKFIISPDGFLNFIPFEALLTENKTYLIEDKNISYISSGKELLRAYRNQKKSQNKMNIIVFSNPNFEVNISIEHSNSNKKSLDDVFIGVDPLPYSQDALFIKNIFKKREKDVNVKIFTKKNANKTNLLKVKTPTILHISTHSSYSKEENLTINDSLLKSVLVLAGHNSNKENDTSALLTALEFSNLNLYQTELVFFSSCQSGLGDISSSEGVYGFNRAAKLAGAKRVISTLWEVADKESAALSKKFYINIEKGKRYVEALRESKLEMIKEGYKPFYWAGFLENGID